jgi:uncharacterized protein (DUF4415 family)
MAKSFKKNTPIDRLEHTKEPKIVVEDTVKTTTTAKRKQGRPPKDPTGRLKRDYTEKVNIAIDKDVMEKVRLASRCHAGTITDYVNALIKKDLDANFDTYQKMIDTINNL